MRRRGLVRQICIREGIGWCEILTEWPGTGLGAADEQRGNSFPAQIRRNAGVNGRISDCG